MKITFFLDVQIGETWVNDQGYRLKVLDFDPQGKELWLEWENGCRGAWTPSKFIEAKYRLYEYPPEKKEPEK